MVCIFTREITDNLASLVKQVDEAVAKNEDKKMAGFLVYLSEDKAGEAQLKALAEKHKIESVPLTVFDGGAEGPKNYGISKDAAVTVMMWKELTVKANHAFGKGKLDKAAITKVVADTSKILE